MPEKLTVVSPFQPILVAEPEGFEPSVRVTPYGGLANRWFQPLTHSSVPHVPRCAAKLGQSRS